MERKVSDGGACGGSRPEVVLCHSRKLTGRTISTFGNVRWYCPMWIRRKPMCMICVLPLTRMDGFMVSFAANAMMTRHRREICRGGGKGGNRTHAQSGGLGTVADLKAASQQRNVVLHPEFVNGKYASTPVRRMILLMPEMGEE